MKTILGIAVPAVSVTVLALLTPPATGQQQSATI